MSGMDYYAVLGVEKNADEKTIRRAFRKLAKKYHPDTNQGDKAAEQKFKEINEAYAILGDGKKRALYDKYGTMAFQEGFDPEAYEAYQKYAGNGFDAGGSFGRKAGSYGSGFGQGAGAFGGGFGQGAGSFGGFRSGGASFGYGNGTSGQGERHEMHFDGADMDDILRNLFQGSADQDLFRGSSGQGRGQRQMAHGRDLQADITVGFEEAALGCEKQITIQGADGRSSTLSVHIPAGMEDGKKLRLKGKGQPAHGSVPAGDLYLSVHVRRKAGYERKGQDIYVTTQIPFVTAVLGGEAKVPTLYGDVMCTIPAGTQSGSRIRLKGKGIGSVKNPERKGDQYIVVQIKVPERISPAQKKLLQEYAQEEAKQAHGGNGHAA